MYDHCEPSDITCRDMKLFHDEGWKLKVTTLMQKLLLSSGPASRKVYRAKSATSFRKKKLKSICLFWSDFIQFCRFSASFVTFIHVFFSPWETLSFLYFSYNWLYIENETSNRRSQLSFWITCLMLPSSVSNHSFNSARLCNMKTIGDTVVTYELLLAVNSCDKHCKRQKLRSFKRISQLLKQLMASAIIRH